MDLGASGASICIQTRKPGRTSEPIAVLAAVPDELDHWDSAAVPTGVFPPVTAVHTKVFPCCHLGIPGMGTRRLTINCPIFNNSFAGHDSII